MSLVGFEETLGGKWILTRNEGFEEYLAAMGIGYIKRKLASKFTTTMEMIKVNDNRIRIITKGPKDMDTQIDIDETTEEVDPFDNKIEVKVTWDADNKILKTDSGPKDGSNAKKAIVERKIVADGEMLMEVTLPNDNIICKRYFKREAA